MTVETLPTDATPLAKLLSVPMSPPSSLRFDIDCTLQYELDDTCHFIFQIEAIDLPDQRIVAERLTLDAIPPSYVIDKLTESTVSQIPSEFVHLLAPTRYCESDLLASAAQQMFGNVVQGWARVDAIRAWIHDNIEYVVGSSDTTTTARDVFVQRKGVCRDFAHLGITFCRALNIPARFVVGYIKFPDGAPDFHAVFEAWLGNQWVIFDATEMAPVEWLIRVGTGRDAKDVPFATIYGPARMLSMAPTVENSAAVDP